MIKRTLRPFVGNEVDAVMGIEYVVWRDGGRIGVEYDIHGMLSHLVIPEQRAGATDKRRDELWRHTCFELFVKEADKKKKGYLECNFSPSGNWNVYSFGSHRKKMRDADVATIPNIMTTASKKIYSLRAEVDLTGLISELSTIDVGVSCIIENRNGKQGYWALSHPKETPDFHDPESFLVRLVGTNLNS